MESHSIVRSMLYHHINRLTPRTGVTKEFVTALYRLTNQNLALNTLELIDREEVSCAKLPNGRKLYQVQGNMVLYTVLPPFTSEPPSEQGYMIQEGRVSFCPCVAFVRGVMATGEAVTCKHMLALLISARTGKLVEIDVGWDRISMATEQSATKFEMDHPPDNDNVSCAADETMGTTEEEL
ncbi:hypothetical protein BT69DRAFT_661108 [Atractiella rhizophila]|nr:hypothetical protein BT69DRAFT_661108 [Atractiella rhizophila]